MTPEDVARVVDTAEMVHEDTGLVARFYELLFERHPELRTMFPADMTELHHRFVTEIEAFARAMPTLTEVESRATLLGARHAGYGVRVAHYPFVRDALLDALEEQLGARFTPEHRQSWTRAYNLLAEIMMESRPPVRAE